MNGTAFCRKSRPLKSDKMASFCYANDTCSSLVPDHDYFYLAFEDPTLKASVLAFASISIFTIVSALSGIAWFENAAIEKKPEIIHKLLATVCLTSVEHYSIAIIVDLVLPKLTGSFFTNNVKH